MKRINLNRPEKNRFRMYLKLAGIILVAVVLLEVWMVNRLSSYGGKLNQIKQTANSLELENRLLENQIARKSSLITSLDQSTKLGFNAISTVEYYKAPAVASAK